MYYVLPIGTWLKIVDAVFPLYFLPNVLKLDLIGDYKQLKNAWRAIEDLKVEQKAYLVESVKMKRKSWVK